MEDLSADDDILSDILVDTLEFEPPISTHKMNPAYRHARFSTSEVISIVRRHVVVEADVQKAAEEISKLGIIRKHLQGKSAKQIAGFQQHAKRYLETYLPDSGVEFALTDRYLTVPERGKKHSTLEDTNSGSSNPPTLKTQTVTHPHPQQRGADRTSSKTGGAAPPGFKADLRVLAMKNYAVGDLIINCKGGVRDLTKAEDEALREEAALSREARKENKYKGVLGQGRDFSVVRSSRKGCSQLFLGPARFVNHDCNPNTEFHRLGSQMVFRAIRPISIGSEITTFYGENYFEWGNSECLCQTCEDRGTGAWGRLEDFPLPPDLLAASKANGKASTSTLTATSHQNQPEDASDDSKGGVRRRSSSRRSVTHSKQASPSTPSTSKISDDAGSFPTDPSSSSHQLLKVPGIPNCKCVTCGALFDPPESWWTPDECGRCERHYKIFKADWPSREPTEKVDTTPRGKGPLVAGTKALKGKGKGKAKAEDSDSDENVKVKSQGKPRGRPPGSGKSKGALKGRKSAGNLNLDSASTTSTSLSSTDEISGSSTPIMLSPLRDLQAPNRYQQPRQKDKRPRKSGSSIDRKTADETKPRNSKSSSSQNVLGDSGSELTEDESDSVAGAANRSANRTERGKEPHRTSSSNPDDDDAATVSSSDSSLAGPKMLGKEATTGTLALFWGAPEGDTRARRQASKASASMQASPGALKTESKKRSFSHQRNGSGDFENLRRSTSTASSSRPIESKSGGTQDCLDVKDEPMDLSELKSTTSSSSNKMKKAGRRSQENEINAASRQNESSTKRSSEALRKGEVKTEDASDSHSSVKSTSASPSPPAIPGLATQGIARTSLSNLALAWSAGSDSSRTRKQASREPLTISSGTSSEERDLSSHPAKRARRSAGAVLTGSSRSETPEYPPKSTSSSVSVSNPQSSNQPNVKRPRGRPPQKARTSIDVGGDGLKSGGKSVNGFGHHARHSTGNQLDHISGSSSQRPRSPLVGSSRGAGSNLPSVSTNDRDFKKPRLETNPGPSHGWPSSIGLQNAKPGSAGGHLQNPITLTPQSHLPRPSTTPNSFSGLATSPPPASTSPLAGPRPGGPIRKNLRWGRGKVSESRAMSSTGGEASDDNSSPKKLSASPLKQANPTGGPHSHSRSNSGSNFSGQAIGSHEFGPNAIPSQIGKMNPGNSMSTITAPMSSSDKASIFQSKGEASSISDGKESASAFPNPIPSHPPPSSLPSSSTTSASSSGREANILSLAPLAPAEPKSSSSAAPSFLTPSDSKILSRATPVPVDDGMASQTEGKVGEKVDLGRKSTDQISDPDVPPSQIFHSQNQQV